MERLSQGIAVATHITPAAARAAGSYVTPAVDGSQYHQLLALLEVGTLSGAATVSAKFQTCSGSASSLAGWADVNSACITSAFASTSNDKIGELELQVHQYGSTLERYLRVLVSATTSSWLGACQVLGVPRYKPATDVDSSDVVQTVVY